MDHRIGPDTLGTSPAKGSVADDEYSALAGLFLDDAPLPHPSLPRPSHAEAETRPEAADTPATIELLVVGHLPVLASAWVAEYARFVSKETGSPVGMVREGRDHTSVDLICPNRDHARKFTAAADPLQAIRSQQGSTSRWMVRSSSDTALARWTDSLPENSAITLLTGADEAAIVATYRTLKSMFGSSEAQSVSQNVRIRVVIMGAETNDAIIAGERVRHASTAFLDREIEVVISNDRVTPGQTSNIFRGDAKLDHASICAAMTEAPIAHQIDSMQSTAEEIDRAASIDLEPLPLEPGPDLVAETDLEPGPKLDSEPILQETPAPRAPKAIPVRKPSILVEVAQSATPRVAPVDVSDALASHIAGLTPLQQLVCPFNESVQFACDTLGRVHLLVSADELQTADLDGFQVAIEALSVVRPWAISHAGLLQMATGGKVKTNTQPTLHLMTSRPVGAKRLLDGDVRVHLLTRAPSHPDAWVCVDLN